MHTMIESRNDVYSLALPTLQADVLPMVLDSPHSGTHYPNDADIIAPEHALKTTWDAYVEELWSGATDVGGVLLAAQFPRAYIDPNRGADDIDPAMLAQPWPDALNPSAVCLRGMGLIRRLALPGVPMYAGALPIDEVQQRITNYYQPYHNALSNLIDNVHVRFGQIWHINCHSMKSVGNAMNVDNGDERPDLVVSDCDGTSADPRLTEWAAAQLSRFGYRVSINSPYHGGHIVRHYGAPPSGRHSIQIEIKRSLYMNESTFEKTAGFERLKRDINLFLSEFAAYIKATIDYRATHGFRSES